MNSSLQSLIPWGWTDNRAGQLAEGEVPARVLAVDRNRLTLQHAQGAATGIWRPAEATDGNLAVGDWCAICPPTSTDGGMIPVRRWLPRRTVIARRAAGKAARAQTLAANVDTVVLVCGLDRSTGIRGLDRLVVLVLDGGAQPLVVLNKVDRCADPEEALYEAQKAAPGVETHLVSATEGLGLDALRQRLAPGTTAVLLGASGAGKSTLTNALAGEIVEHTAAVRAADHRGRHTTTRRTLHRLPSDLLLIDTPGLRELGMWLDGDGLDEAFGDISSLARHCRFRDCTHNNEPDCAVRQAMEDGVIEPRRFWRYLELQEEAKVVRLMRDDPRHRGNSKARHKGLSKIIRRMKKR